MDEEKLNQILEKVEENNKILKKMHRASVWGGIFRAVYWAVIIIAAVGAYWFIQPFFNTIISAYKEIQTSKNNLINVTSKIPSSIGDLFK